MPKYSRFSEHRFAQLLGLKTRKIHKIHHPGADSPSQPLSSHQTPSEKIKHAPKSTFKASQYVQMKKVHKNSSKEIQFQSRDFRVYKDEEMFEGEIFADFLKLPHDNDHDTPEETTKYDVNRGIRRLKQELEQRLRQSGGSHLNDGTESEASSRSSRLGIRIAR